MFAVRNYQQGVQRLLAACDEALLDQDFKEGKFHLQVPSRFYDGMRVDADTLQAMLAQATVANLVGKETINIAVEGGFVARDHVLVVDGVPHAQFMVMVDG